MPETVLMFDEYFNYPFWDKHEYKAMQEFIAASEKNYEYIAYNKRAEQVAVRFV